MSRDPYAPYGLNAYRRLVTQLHRAYALQPRDPPPTPPREHPMPDSSAPVSTAKLRSWAGFEDDSSPLTEMLLAAAAELDALRAQAAWRPIGEWTRARGPYLALVCTSIAVGEATHELRSDWSWMNGTRCDPQPTHWMPLPAPPADASPPIRSEPA